MIKEKNIGYFRNIQRGFPDGSAGEESACNEGNTGSIPGLGRSPGGGNANTFQYSCLENPMDRGAQSPQGHKELDTTQQSRQKHIEATELDTNGNICTDN